MYIQRNTFKSPSGKEYRTTLLCESHREGKKVKTKAILNLSRLPEEIILSIENTLKSKTEAVVKEKDIFVESCYDFGYVFVIEQSKLFEILNLTTSQMSPTDRKAV